MNPSRRYARAQQLKPDDAATTANWCSRCNFSRLPLRNDCRPRLRAGRAPRRAAPAIAQSHTHDRDPARRLVRGYVSPDFRVILSGAFMPLLRCHDHERLGNLLLFPMCLCRPRDPLFRARPIIGGRPEEDAWAMAEQIRADGVDILVILPCHRRQPDACRCGRPAPDCNEASPYPEARGRGHSLPLSDRYLEPPGTGRPIRSMKRSVWKAFGVTNPIEGGPAVECASAWKPGGGDVWCLNSFCKSTDGAGVVGRVLGEFPLAAFAALAHAAHRQRVLGSVEAGWVDAPRVSFVDWQPRPHTWPAIIASTSPWILSP